jgi:hypothetical protein
LNLLAGAADDIMHVAPLEPVQKEKLVVTVHRIGAQPGVEAVEVGEADREVGHDPAEQLGPGDQLL